METFSVLLSMLTRIRVSVREWDRPVMKSRPTIRNVIRLGFGGLAGVGAAVGRVVGVAVGAALEPGGIDEVPSDPVVRKGVGVSVASEVDAKANRSLF